MLGYIFAAIVGVIVLGFALSAFGGGRSQAGNKPRSVGSGGPLQPNGPSADEPTPDRSAVASDSSIDAAKERTPPA
jgi:hypothetical protein